MKNIILIVCTLFGLVSCSVDKKIVISNDLDFTRREVIEIPFEDLGLAVGSMDVFYFENADGQLVPQQVIYADSSNSRNVVLLDVHLDAGESQELFLFKSSNRNKAVDVKDGTFGRFVPERIDDFAWENNRVAFRTYGPEAQRLVDENQKGGTLSSGIDCWLKRTDSLIIDKWYAKYMAGGTYHQDDGEGYDPYHVGASRGCGGLGFLAGDSLFVSKNFVSHNVKTNGPLRTVFELTYAPWSANGVEVRERKVITIERGQQFCKVEAHLESDSTLDFTIGITLHDKKGDAKLDPTAGWFRYWETIDDSQLGTGIVIDPGKIISSKDFRTEKKDLSHIYISSKTKENVLTYYPGFAWKKAGAIATLEAWDQHLLEFSKRLQSPIRISIEQ